MNEPVPVGPTTRFGRLERRGVLLGLTGSQLGVLAVAGGLLVLGMYSHGGAGLLITAVLWVPLTVLALVGYHGRPLVTWLPISAQWTLRKLAGQTEYRARPTLVRRVGRLALPGDAARLRLLVVPTSGAALVHDPIARTLTCVAAVSAPAFDLVDAPTQQRRVDAWGRLLASLTPSSGVARIHTLTRTVPESGVDLARYWAAHGVRDGSWAARVVADLVATAASRARHESYLAISLDVARVGAVRKAIAAAQRRMTAIGSAAEQADLRVRRWLDPGELCWLVRTAYEPATAITTPAPDTGTVGHPGPMAVSEEWDRLRADSAWHVVYWIAEWPREETPASFLQPLIFAGATHCLSIITKPQPIAKALREIRKAKADHHADAAQRSRLGQLADEALVFEAEEVVARERELAAGHAVCDFTGLLTVTAAEVDQLDAACAELEVAAASAGCELRRLVGQQAQAFAAAALPLGRGLA